MIKHLFAEVVEGFHYFLETGQDLLFSLQKKVIR